MPYVFVAALRHHPPFIFENCLSSSQEVYSPDDNRALLFWGVFGSRSVLTRIIYTHKALICDRFCTRHASRGSSGRSTKLQRHYRTGRALSRNRRQRQIDCCEQTPKWGWSIVTENYVCSHCSLVVRPEQRKGAKLTRSGRIRWHVFIPLLTWRVV
jgi:hypothetical protein